MTHKDIGLFLLLLCLILEGCCMEKLYTHTHTPLYFRLKRRTLKFILQIKSSWFYDHSIFNATYPGWNTNHYWALYVIILICLCFNIIFTSRINISSTKDTIKAMWLNYRHMTFILPHYQCPISKLPETSTRILTHTHTYTHPNNYEERK